LQFYHEDKLYSLLLLKSLHTDHDLHPSVESKASEVEFVELSEDTQETEEVLELVPDVGGLSEDTNLAGTQGKPQCIYTYVFLIIIQ
jgi:hypothetical protein